MRIPMPNVMACTLLGAVALTHPSQAESGPVVAAKVQAAIDRSQPPAWMNPTLPDDVKSGTESKGRGLAEYLKLGDDAKTKAVGDLLAQHYARVWAWHQAVDKDLEAAWANWNAARDTTKGEKDDLKALTVMTEEIDPIEAQFAPQIVGLLRDLGAVISQEQIVELLDRLTRTPGVDRTYKAYLAMVPEMTEAEQKILRTRLEQAREDSLAAWSDKQIIRTFKKYKIRNEFSIDHFGYGYKKRYEAWINASKK